MRTIFQKFGYLGTTMLVVTLLCWASVFWIHGLAGAFAWSALKFAIPVLGLAGIVLNAIGLVILLLKKKNTAKKLVNLALSAVLALHILLTMNIIQFAYPVHIQDVQPAVTVKWPFAGQAVVGWGGDSTENNLPHVLWPSERWAYDLVMEPYDNGSTNPENYGVWNQEVLSPVSGTVIAAYDAEADIVPGSEDILSMEGNHVYLEIDETGTFLLLNHLKKDSVSVKVGDHVQAGDILGHVGNSGSTSEPHLHIHHQRQNPLKTGYPILAEGLPLYFEGTDSEPMPTKGTVVTPEQ